jgi:transcriptional regulator with XRE-family HTH domain
MLKEFGQDLKKLRELKGISLAEISAETRINIKFLQLLENGVFDFQPETYVRSFIKEYAKAINENENQLINDYDKAKAGFYSRRKFTDNLNQESASENLDNQQQELHEISDDVIYNKSLLTNQPDYYKKNNSASYTNNEKSYKPVIQKILIAILIAAILAGIYFLIDYLNSQSNKKTDVTPKTFDEIASDYEGKINKQQIDSARILDSLKNLAKKDSLYLSVKALKDVKIKLYIDDKSEPIDELISAKDSVTFSAKEKFRFSANTSQNVELYLNGKYLKKSNLSSNSSIKNLIINKEGIQQQ